MPNIAYFCAMVLRTQCTGHCSGLYGKYGIPVRGGGQSKGEVLSHYLLQQAREGASASTMWGTIAAVRAAEDLGWILQTLTLIHRQLAKVGGAVSVLHVPRAPCEVACRGCEEPGGPQVLLLLCQCEGLGFRRYCCQIVPLPLCNPPPRVVPKGGRIWDHCNADGGWIAVIQAHKLRASNMCTCRAHSHSGGGGGGGGRPREM